MNSLTRIGSMCSLVEHEIHHLPLCMACALTKRVDVLRGRFRYDSVDETLVCNECARQTYVVNINMLGRVLYVREKTIVLCENCMQPRYWDHTCPCTGESAGTVRTCCACSNSNIVSVKEVVDVDSMLMRLMHFCYKHSMSCVLNQATIYDMKSLEQEIQAKRQPTANIE